MDSEAGELAFLPLGGTGEIGMNLNLYRWREGGYEKWLAVDCGIGFGGSELPEVEVMMADPGFIADRKDKLVGLVITHAHEDHIGAVAWLWPQLKCPVYCTPFAAAVLRRKLAEVGLTSQVRVHVIAPGGSIDLKPFVLRFIRLAHSIPEAQALVIDTPAGTVLHTGDWKLDATPLLGPPTDEAALAALGEKGVLAMVCDSTNAMVEGHSGSELDVRRSLSALIRDLRGRVAVTCFASNVARMESVGAGGARRGAQRGHCRPVAAQHGRGRPRVRLSEDPAAVPHRGRHRRRTGRQHPAADHRQPGRGAQCAVAHRTGRPSAGCRWGRAIPSSIPRA